MLDSPFFMYYTTTCKEKCFTGGMYMCVKLELINNNELVSAYNSNDAISDILDKKYELSLLYDYYGNLLKENHKQIFEGYVLDDMSLSEIATEYGITRQAVHDSIKRSTKHLNEYEEKLGLIRKHSVIVKKIDKMKSLAEKLPDKDKNEAMAILESISREV